jgi:hypothetical protein
MAASERPAVVDRAQVRAGVEVFSSDGERIGKVKEVRQQDFLLDRPMARDLYVPLDAIDLAAADRVILNLPSNELGERNWPEAPLI